MAWKCEVQTWVKFITTYYKLVIWGKRKEKEKESSDIYPLTLSVPELSIFSLVHTQMKHFDVGYFPEFFLFHKM